jgi:hypothetical protein
VLNAKGVVSFNCTFISQNHTIVERAIHKAGYQSTRQQQNVDMFCVDLDAEVSLEKG